MTFPRCSVCRQILRTYGDIATHRGHEPKLSWAKRFRIKKHV